MEPSPTNSGAPLTVRFRRLWRLFRSRSKWVQGLAAVLAVVLIGDLVALGVSGSSTTGVAAPGHSSSNTLGAGSGGPGGGGGAGGTTAAGGAGGAGGAAGGTAPAGGTVSGGGGGGGSGAGGGAGGTTPLGVGPGGAPLTASDRGVTPTSIRVVFPWANLSAFEAAFSFNGSSEDDVTSIHTYVDDINAHGGINGRRIDPEIVSYDPTNDADMKAKCQQWTQVEKVFAVIDTYAWHDDNQLCVTQQGHTPLLSGWTSVSNQLNQGSPYLWWTGNEQVAALENLVSWARGAGLLTKSTKFGVLYADRSSDSAVRQQFGAALARAGLSPADVETMHYDALDQSQATAQGSIAVHNFQIKGVTVVLPLIPVTTLTTYLTNEKLQAFFPRLLLSDFEQSISAGLGLLDSGAFDAPLNNQLGTTSLVLGNSDGPKTEGAAPGYSPAEADCWHVFVAHNPKYAGTSGSPWHGFIESTGTAETWCQNIRLFAAAARLAGPNLTRDGFDTAMATLSSFPGTVVPNLSFGPSQRAGSHLARVVRIHKNSDSACPAKQYDNTPQGTCWMIAQDFQPMQRI